MKNLILSQKSNFCYSKHCIESEKKFDFLKELVANIADVSNQDEEDGAESEKPKRQ